MFDTIPLSCVQSLYDDILCVICRGSCSGWICNQTTYTYLGYHALYDALGNRSDHVRGYVWVDDDRIFSVSFFNLLVLVNI